MKRHNAIVKLSRDNQKGLMLAQLLKKNAPKYKGLPEEPIGKRNYALETFEKDLTQHFEDEEKILFPSAKGKSKECDDLIDELINEHKFFYEKIPALENSPNLINEMDLIGHRLEEHIRKEERILFNLIQELLTEDELIIIKSKIEQSRKDFLKSCKTNSA
ncbi:Hemerythrin HHE cation binding domain protein [Ignavibacterium album JCM 16511]|uniref:Hemerythrin HHE cation binding domain protein n=1 Tax=Ignavibacterium album (strain DSM 19864 / JCM 16511 / NBRC 101810 / Mat9-16) TaxID=945713 RepID=I0AHW4_IGNAJ|nr:hemerythrin domain-containing protein [Ignavibacterium album]AFH48571.1 Hemerythrin HHE cation binding domain protein [Ignavibacterium album JCM 16511]